MNIDLHDIATKSHIESSMLDGASVAARFIGGRIVAPEAKRSVV